MLIQHSLQESYEIQNYIIRVKEIKVRSWKLGLDKLLHEPKKIATEKS